MDLLILPTKIKDRSINTKYLFKGKTVIWDGKILRCKHKKEKRYCRDCKGSGFCKHNKFKSICRDCKGSGFCKHNKRKSICRECKGSGFCKHNKQKIHCRECNGSAFCKHNKYKSRCRDCEGTSICNHNKYKSQCRECGGSAFCKHNKRKSRCRECGGSAFCKHNKQKIQCRDCGETSICKHNKRKSRCGECGGSDLCKSSWCETITNRNRKYNGYCLRCCVFLHPEIKVVRNYKTKENEVYDRIKKQFPSIDWISDKSIKEGCSKRRPDVFADFGSHILIVEIDEKQHNDYDCSCENKRLMEISRDVGHRPIVFIRFNPDSYIDKSGKKISSCWKHNKSGLMYVYKKDEWETRLKCLFSQIQYWSENITTKIVEIIELYYN